MKWVVAVLVAISAGLGGLYVTTGGWVGGLADGKFRLESPRGNDNSSDLVELGDAFSGFFEGVDYVEFKSGRVAFVGGLLGLKGWQPAERRGRTVFLGVAGDELACDIESFNHLVCRGGPFMFDLRRM